MNPQTHDEPLMTRKDVCRFLQLSRPTVLRLEAAGKLPVIRLGAGSIRIRRADVEAFVAQCATVKR
jgi:excisionase family DNA binding protein